MIEQGRKILLSAEFIEPPQNLLDKIVRRIYSKQRLSLKRHILIFGIISALSLASLVPIFNMAKANFAASGFFHFFSLIFSDFNIVVSYWKNFSVSLLESLPVTSLMLAFGALFIFLESIRLLARDIKKVFSRQQLLVKA